MPESLVGRIFHACHDGRDLTNMFCLIAEDGPETVTLVPVRTEIVWVDDCNGRERPIPPDDADAALRACPSPEKAFKHFDPKGNPLLRQGILTYRLWDGQDVPCRYL